MENYIGKYIRFQKFSDSPTVYVYVKSQETDYFCGDEYAVLIGQGFSIDKENDMEYKDSKWNLIVEAEKIKKKLFHKVEFLTEKEFYEAMEHAFLYRLRR